MLESFNQEITWQSLLTLSQSNFAGILDMLTENESVSCRSNNGTIDSRL